MNRERMTKLYEFFKDVPKNQVNLGTWDCGTHACLAGWACRIPEFQAEGLVNQNDTIEFEEETGFSALSSFFGLTYAQAVHMFGTSQSRPVKEHKEEALSRLERAIKEY